MIATPFFQIPVGLKVPGEPHDYSSVTHFARDETSCTLRRRNTKHFPVILKTAYIYIYIYIYIYSPSILKRSPAAKTFACFPQNVFDKGLFNPPKVKRAVTSMWFVKGFGSHTKVTKSVENLLVPRF